MDGLVLTNRTVIIKLIFSACLSLTVLQLEAPAYVKLGDSLSMDCSFVLEGKTLYRYDNQWGFSNFQTVLKSPLQDRVKRKGTEYLLAA